MGKGGTQTGPEKEAEEGNVGAGDCVDEFSKGRKEVEWIF